MLDQLRQMVIFAKTVNHGSFRGAARALSLSPSVVSHHISQLEEHLGVALLYRTTRKLSLTREGERLLAATQKMLEAIEGELFDLSASANAPSGTLKVTVPSVLSQSDFTDRIAAFLAAYPRITLSLDFSDTRHALVEGGFDFAVRMGPRSKTSATSRKLFSAERKLVASPSYFASKAAPQHPGDIVDWDWIALIPAQNVPLLFRHASGQTTRIKVTPRALSNDAQALYRLSLRGAGLAVVPAFLAEADAARGDIIQVLPDWTLPSLTITAEWPANAPKHGLVHLALRELAKPL